MTTATTGRPVISVGTLSTSLADLHSVEDWARVAAQAAAGPPVFAAELAAGLDEFDEDIAALVAQTQDELDRQYVAACFTSRERIPASELAAPAAA